MEKLVMHMTIAKVAVDQAAREARIQGELLERESLLALAAYLDDVVLHIGELVGLVNEGAMR